MGILDALSTAADVTGKYIADRFTGLGHAYRDAWTKNLPQSFQGVMAGSLTMAQSYQPDRDSFGKGLKLWLDSALGVGSSLLQGTIGGAFEAPGLHETGWALDKAYRYGVARPLSWGLVNSANAQMEASKARQSGGDYLSTYMSGLLNKDMWIGDRGMWSDQIGDVTPGQAIIWNAGGLVGQLNPGNTSDPASWLRSHDPRTAEGQKKFNSDNPEFLLKYASGTLDLALNMAADPSHGSSLLVKAGKAKYFDHIATPEYVAKGGVEREITSKNTEKVFQASVKAPNPENLRLKVMPHARFGGQVSTVLWTAARMSRDVWNDSWVVARGLDGARDAATGIGAWDRLVTGAPRIASDFARIFANWNIGEDSMMLGRNAEATKAVESLVLNDVDAFTSAMANREGIWGTLPGKLMNEKQPKVTMGSSLRAGIHSWAMDVAPVMIGRPAAKLAQSFLPSQGWTPFIDNEDPTGIALRQFRANLERSGMPTKDIEEWVSNWGAKGSREGRGEVAERAEPEAIKVVAQRLGLTPEFIAEAMPLLNRHRAGTRQLVQRTRVYISERASRLAAYNVALGRAYEAAALKSLNKGLTKQAKRGQFGDVYAAMPDADGRLNLVALADTRERPPQAPDVNRPVLGSQTEPVTTMLDYRMLEGQLKWYKRAHPVPMVRDADTGIRRLPKTDEERQAASLTAMQSMGRPLAKMHSAWDAAITAADFANMAWKSSALLRPAQTPRNLADDTLRRLLVFGKLHILMGAMTGTKRAFQNFGRRDQMRHDVNAELLAKRQASRTSTLEGSSELDPADVADKVPGPTNENYGSIGAAWLAGAFSIDDFIKMLKLMAGGAPHDGAAVDVPRAIEAAFNAHGLKVYSTAERIDKLDFNATEAERKAWDKKQPPKSGPWHDRQLKRRIIEYYIGPGVTRFLDDLRLSQVHRRTGEPLDPRYAGVDHRAIWLTQLINKHTTERRGATKNAKSTKAVDGTVDQGERTGTIENPYRPAQMVVDPFTGLVPKDFDSLDDFTILYHETLDIASRVSKGVKTGVPLLTNPSAQMGNFIVDNIDDLLKPRHLLSLSVMPDGNIRMGVARAKPKAVEELGQVKPGSATQRRKNFKFKEILDAGHQDITIRARNGGDDSGTITFPAAFGGPDGEAMQHRVSSEGGLGSWNYLVGDTSMSRMLDKMGGWGQISPGQRGYGQSWERAVNAQLSSDPVARMFLEGATDSDVLNWIESHPEGSKYLHRVHYFGVNYPDHVHQIEAMVNEYVPPQDSKAGKALRQAILDKTATYDHLKAVEPDVSLQPEVHGASMQYLLGKGAVFDMVTRGIDKAQKLLADIPTDKASKYPFFAESYRRHLTDLVKTADHQAELSADLIPVRLLQNLEHQARDRALYDTRYHLYDTAQMNDLARMTRLVVPFSSAIMDSYIKYGRIIRENPGTVLQGAYYWELFERNQQIQDENGYVLRKETGAGGAEENWYSVDPETGAMTRVDADKVGDQRYVQFRLPSDLAHMVGKKFFGVDVQPVMAINKKSFNVFLDLPATGPLVALPVNEFALSNPEFGESEVIKKFVLPFGPSASRGKVFLPATVRTAWDIFAGDDGLKAEGQAKAIFQAELIAYQRGERDNPPNFTEVRSRAAMMQGLRFATSFISPLSFQTNSPYQPYIDAYRQLAAVDPAGADEAFLARYGQEFYAVAMTVTRNNAGIRSTLASDASFKKHADLINAYPDLAGLITGSEGSGAFNSTAFKSMKEQLDQTKFSKSVYESQKVTPLRPGSDKMVREVMSLEDSVAELEKRRVWQEYSKMQDVLTADMADKGLTSMRGSRAAELVKIRDAFIVANKYWTDPVSGQQVISPWYNDFTAVDHALMDKRIDAMWQIVQDPGLQKRDDIRGLISYLSLRESMQTQMASQGVKSLASQNAAALADTWRNGAFALREKNPAFGALWNRWLSRDDQLILGGV